MTLAGLLETIFDPLAFAQRPSTTKWKATTKGRLSRETRERLAGDWVTGLE